MDARRPGAWQDLAGATLLASLLCAIWTMRDWPALSALHLPDTDDAVRLQQIRDWLAGQRIGDLAQHRLGAPPGLQMHWSRLPDLVPGAIVALLTGAVGRHGAEVVAVILWPALLFAAALWLVARIARRAGAPSGVAMLVAGLAYPATTLFLPGRIDHHGLQMVLVLVLAHRLLAPATLADGAVAGLAVAASLAIGLETAPLLVVAGGVLLVDWIRGGDRARMLGFGAALVAALLAAGVLLRTSGWDYPACDGFDRQLWQAATLAACAPLALALIGDRVGGRWRTVTAVMVCGIFVAMALIASPACLRPYGAVDAALARAWLAQVGEAQPLLGAPIGEAIGYAGLMLAGIGAGAVLAWRTRARPWTILLAFQMSALLVTLVQLRGAYAGALLAAPALAATIAAARVRGTGALVGAWALSAGIAYPLLAGAIDRPGSADAAAAPCDQQAMLARLARLPTGRLLASIDLGAYALAATPHQVIAAPYHRNTAGNRASLAVLQARAPEGAAVLRRWRVDYLALCPGDLAGADDSLAGRIGRGVAPAWLKPLEPKRPGAQVYRVLPR